MAYPLGGKYGISHGLSNSILLADVMEFNAEAVPEKFVKIAEAMGIKTTDLSEEQAIKSAIDEIREIVDDVGIAIKGFKASKVVIDDLSRLSMSEQRLIQNNPRPIEYEDAQQIYRKALSKYNLQKI